MSLDRIRVLKTGGRRLLAGLIAALACLTGCSEAPTRVESASLVLEGCRVITMRSSDVLEGVTIVVNADTIAAMGSDGTLLVPDSVPRLDCKGDFVLPGLTDAHVHIGHPTELISYLLSGVTTVFNLGGDHIDLFSGDRLDVLQLQDSVAAGRYPGPTIYSAGQALDGDPPTGPYQLGLASAEEAAEAVRQQFERGFDFIKVYDGLDETVHTAIV
ncbi:MAG: hypothetical protein HKP01_12485, partial [Gemmatimonadetes bacterium]|nr:hypothetical protein [Gemmatimonadota bacterium]